MSIEETTKKILDACRAKGYEPNEIDEENVQFWCGFFECEPMALSQKIEEELDVLTYSEVFNLL